MIERLSIIGCGLLGGSVALALRRAGLVRHIAGHSRTPASSRRTLELGVAAADVMGLGRAPER